MYWDKHATLHEDEIVEPLHSSSEIPVGLNNPEDLDVYT